MILLTPIRRLLGWSRPSFFVAPPALRTARDTVGALPDVVKAVLVLPTLAEQLAHVERNTDALPEMVEELRRVRQDTAVLHGMRTDTAAIAAEMPKLVVLERSLPAMLPMLEDLDRSVHQLADIAEPLHGAARRLGRINDRLPARNGH